MRHSMRALIGAMLVGWLCGQTMAAEAGARWWPFGKREAADVSQPPASQAESATTSPSQTAQQPTLPEQPLPAEPERRWMIESPLAKVSWPRVHMPEVPKPKRPKLWPEKSEVDAAKNSWVEKDPISKEPSPLQAMNDGARRVGQSTRNAWDKTVDVFTPGESAQPSSSRTARRPSRPARPSFWKRMFAKNETQVDGPQTVTEWMAQERIDP